MTPIEIKFLIWACLTLLSIIAFVGILFINAFMKMAKDINTIAIVHSGWSGTFNYINEKMIIKLQTMGANLKNLSIAIGPSIAQESYQVGDEFYEKFIKQNKDSQKFFIKINNKWHYNNAEYIAQKYHAHDIENIFINKQNTYTDDDLFSHRYYTHFGKKNGRMLGFIML